MNSCNGEKYQRLLEGLKQYRTVAVAYSGGVDSTLLAYAACDSLGPENVLILHAASCLLPHDTVQSAVDIIKIEFDARVRFKKIDVEPMQHPSIVKNDAQRCYFCKNLIYSKLIEKMKQEGIEVLIDGTNLDDLKEDRPGRKALIEFGVKTPYVEAGFLKSDIRAAASELGLSNALLPSNSCLATRIEQNTAIESSLLQTIEKMEKHLCSKGYLGCRVRPRGNLVVLEVREADFSRISVSRERKQIVLYFRDNGYDKVLIDLAGRV